MKTQIPPELRHLRPTDRWFHEISDNKHPFKPGEFWHKDIVRAVFGIQEKTTNKKK